MTPKQFLENVLPTTGYYVLLIIDGAKRRQIHYEDLDTLLENASYFDARQETVYYAIASYKTPESRKHINVLYLQTFIFDVDCGKGKPYENQQEGAAALVAFIKATGLPKPLVVNSGHGLHVYFLLDKPLTAMQWGVYSKILRGVAEKLKFQADYNKTIDASTVLRIIETHNYKGPPQTVTLVRDGERTNSNRFLHLLDELNKKYKCKIDTTDFTSDKRTTSKVFDALETSSYSPAKADKIGQQCQQIARVAVARRGDVSEPIWRATLGIAAFCDESERVAIEWSDGYEGFSKEETLAKIAWWKANAKGATTCAHFEEVNPEDCLGCLHRGKINSPIRFGWERKSLENLLINGTQLKTPGNFRRTEKGVEINLCRESEGENWMLIAPYDVYPKEIQYDSNEGFEKAVFSWNKPLEGYTDLPIRLSFLQENCKEFRQSIADKGMLLLGAEQVSHMNVYMRHFINELQQAQKTLTSYTSFGWKEDNTAFLIGDTLYKNELGEVKEIDIVKSRQTEGLSDALTTKGKYKSWKRMTELLDNPELELHKFVLACGFGSLIMPFTNIGGALLSLAGPTGSGKSTAQRIVCSIFGNPTQLLFGKNATANAMTNRMGVLSNIPICIEELTNYEAEKTSDLIYNISSGRGRERIDRNGYERPTQTWKGLVISSSNSYFSEKLSTAKACAEAEMMRLLEVHFAKSPVFQGSTRFGRMFNQLLEDNYGFAGREYIKNLVSIYKDIPVMYKQTVTEFYDKWNFAFSGEERFIEAIFCCADLAAQLTQQWNIVECDFSSAISTALKQVTAHRETVKENVADPIDMIGRYMNEFVANTFTIRYDGLKHIPQPPIPDRDIHIRVEFTKVLSDKKFGGTVYIHRHHFYQWLNSKGYNRKDFLTFVRNENMYMEPKSLPLAKHSGRSIPAVPAFGIKLSHQRVIGILNELNERLSFNTHIQAVS